MKTSRLEKQVSDPYARGRVRLRAAMRLAKRENLAPPPHLTLSQWWREHMWLSAETSASTGKVDAFAYQVGIMDAITDAANEEIDVMKSARVGFTKILDAAIGYYIAQDPSPQLAVQPRTEDAEDYSTTEIEPMLRDIDVLAEINGNVVGRARRQRMLKRVFRNGSSVAFVGANSPGGFRRITCRIVYFDEVDGYPAAGAGKEGDQIKLGTKRTLTFWNRKIVAGSTPTIRLQSRIETRFAETDMRFFFVPCPHCGQHQVLEFGDRESPFGFKWQKDQNGRLLPDSVVYVCRANGCEIDESFKEQMVAAGEWRPTAETRDGPSWADYLYEMQRKKPPLLGRIGFHIWTAYSLFPNASWPKIVAEWIESYSNPLTKQTFFNTVLGQTFEDYGDRPLDEELLAKQAEVWPDTVPPGIAVVTCGVDVQDDRVEIETVGWGHNEESWSIDYTIIPGDPANVDFWEKDVDAHLQKIWRRSDQMGFEVMATCVDSGGHHTQRVYDFCKKRIGRRVWAIKGESARDGKRSPVWPTAMPSKRRKQQFKPVIIGTNAAKDAIRYRLHLKKPKELGEKCGGFMHFPTKRDINYFAQLTSEKLVTKLVRGYKIRIWELPPGRANEALDCRVYAYAALCGLLHLGLKLNQRVEEVTTQGRERLLPAPAPEEQQAVGKTSAPGVAEVRGPTITVETAGAKRSSLASKLPK